MNTDNSFFNLLTEINDFGTIKSPDFIAFVLPLLQDIKLLHEQSLTAQITSIQQISYTQFLSLKTNGKPLKKNKSALFKKPENESSLGVIDTVKQVKNIEESNTSFTNLSIHLDDTTPISKPVYLLDYKCWDLELEHCDPLTDNFILGQILASVAFGLDFRISEDLELFIENRHRLYFLNKNLHPTILSVIFEMTNLYREDRTENLEEVITKLKNYREYNPENYVDLTETVGFRNQDTSKRGNWILAKLKNRLFDISRRNKLLYYKEGTSFLNLTIGSVPILLDYKNVQEKSLIYWNNTIQKKIIQTKKLNLNTYFEFNENRFLAPTLNKIRLEARKNKNEYGFSQLRIVIAFIHWYNFKEDKEERITSPLLLLPTEIIKKKGVKDQYSLTFESSEAEINPILSNYLKDLYDINLPDYIDLETTNIEDLIQSIKNQIAKGGSGIKLEWRDKPMIKIIHSIAKRNFNFKSKKLENRSRQLNLRSFNYSYNQDDFQPLGLQIFNDRVRYKNNALEYIINEDLKPSDLAIAEKERTFYTTDNDGEINPLIWEIDTCNFTIGNFNYRKMSLVRDYNEIINTNATNTVFEKLFDEFNHTKPVDSNTEFKLEDNYPIISSDPTQTASIQFARKGDSYIIQGPPGTGKSQTITNLIADYIARDKKILFICEKRAALDVVFHRLKNRKLDDLCCLIHDSQTDKKSFILNLKSTYESFLKNDINSIEIIQNRDKVIDAINQEIEKIKYFHNTMQKGDVAPLELLSVLHQTKEDREFPSEVERVYFPNYKEWKDNQQWIIDWIEQLKINGFDEQISTYVFAQLSINILNQNNPKAYILEKTAHCTNLLDEFNEFIDNFDLDESLTFLKWKEQFELANKIKGLLETDTLSVFDPNSNAAKELLKLKNNLTLKQKEKQEIEDLNAFWKTKLNNSDLSSAISQWGKFENSIFRFINPNFYKLKKQINAIYDFEAHTIKPNISDVLQRLQNEYTIESEIDNSIKEIEFKYKITDFTNFYNWVENIQQKPNETLTSWMSSDSSGYTNALINFNDDFYQLTTNSELLFGKIDALTLKILDAKLSISKSSITSLSAFIPFIKNVHNLSKEMKTCLYEKKWTSKDFSFNIAYKSLHDIYEKERPFSEINEESLKLNVLKTNILLSKYYDCNVDILKAKIQSQFLNKIRITESVAANLTSDEKILKKTYNSARRILENEFGKSMRYKSIRELASSDANTIMTNIKPVWLMSPISISDTMPIDTSLFDVVIYDEASQITIEEGIPALFRTKQAIIVGDEMQMPPTNFFSSNNSQDEEDDVIEETIGISLDADSLLNQGSRKLSSIMLGWHYRSRRESLISFSNAAFYNRNLLTIPDNIILHTQAKKLNPIADVDTKIDVDSILNRSISFHYLENAIYDNRKNIDEANYIANMVSELLKENVKKSIGIVAFSMQQQSEIEAALDRLSVSDPIFETLLEEEYQRIDEDSFNGLFVKNLENVQGDERDIIIMSICYGTNTKGKILMNFGPINRRGGEKRLNVIFSRAKQHMVVVTSILPNEIKNDYNIGANYFKRFLKYSKHISDGKLHDANLILDSLSSQSNQENDNKNTIVSQLKNALESKGHKVDLSIGQSHFKCDLGIINKEKNKYALGILIDNKEHYNNSDILEQYCQKPEILNIFGWEIITVYSKDWFEKPNRVLELIDQKLKGTDTKIKVKIEDIIKEVDTKSITTPKIKTEKKITTKNQTKSKEQNTDKIKSQTNLEFERYEFTEGSSNKFWEISVKDCSVIVYYGRIGNKPQSNIKTFDTAEKAKIEKSKMANKKISKGYIKITHS